MNPQHKELEKVIIMNSNRHATEFLINFLNLAELSTGFPDFSVSTHFSKGDDEGRTSVWSLETDTYNECGARRIFDNKRNVKTFFFDPSMEYTADKVIYDDEKTAYRGGLIVFNSTWQMLNKHMFEGFKDQNNLPDLFKTDLEENILNLPALDEKYHHNYGMLFSSYMYRPDFKLKYTKDFSHQPFKYLKRGIRVIMPFSEYEYEKQANVLKNLNNRLDEFNYSVRHSETFSELEKKYPPNWSIIADRD